MGNSALFFASLRSVVAPSFVYLSDLTETSSTNGWGPIQKDRSNGEDGAADGNPIILNGVTYAKGIGCHATSDIIYTLPAATYSRFISDIGVDDEVVSSGSVVFEVYFASTKVYDSGLMVGTTATKTIDIDITGVSSFRLTVTNGGDGAGGDHADWAGARFVLA